MTEPLSIIIPSKDEVKTLLSLLNDLLKLSDDIIVIDSSNEQNFNLLREELKKELKIRLFRTPPMGYPDPIRNYALSLSLHDWILYLDTDEKLSPALLKEVPYLIQDKKAEAFQTKRICVRENHSRIFFSRMGACIGDYQIRLFKKSKVVYRGIIHESPTNVNNLVKLPSEYCIYHFANGKKDNSKIRRYMLFELFENRYTYDRVVSKLSPIMRRIWNLWIILSKKELSAELSPFLYYLLTILQDLRKGDLYCIFNVYSLTKKRILSLIASDLKEYSFQVSQEIQRTGVINFLSIDTEPGIKSYENQFNESTLNPSDFFIFKILSKYNDSHKIIGKAYSAETILKEFNDLCDRLHII